MIKRESLESKQKHIKDVLSSERFLNKEGLGNEVPFFICPYLPNEGEKLYKIIEKLISELKKKEVTILHINLYDLALDILENREGNLLGRIIAEETNLAKDELKDLLQSVLDTEDYLIPEIEKAMLAKDNFDILFISGIGEVFPYIRSHNVLNNLQSKAKDKPTVMFFPGEYTQSPKTGASLSLFSCLEDDRYYRAFNLDSYNV